MVARLITGKSIRGALSYNEQKVAAGKAELLLAHRFLQEPQALSFQAKLARFERLLEKSPQVRTNTLHLSLNFAVGEKLATDKLQRLAAAYMEGIGFGAQPYLVYRHLDTAHPHLHIVTTNVRADGSRIDLHNIGRNRSEPVRRKLEIAFGLVRAEDRRPTPEPRLSCGLPEPARYGQSETRKTLSRIVSFVTRRYNYTSLAELNAVLGTFRVSAACGGERTRQYRNQGLVYQITDGRGQPLGVPLKASALPGKPTLAYLEKRFAHNLKTRRLFREALRQRIDSAIGRGLPPGRGRFVQRLRQEGIQVLFRESAGGVIYGVTFVDHRRLVVLNGRELGKDYGARALTARLQEETPLAQAASRQLPLLAGPRVIILPPPVNSTPGLELLQELLQAQTQEAPLPGSLRARRKKRKQKRRLS